MLPFLQVVQKELEDVNQLIIKQLHSDVELVENIGHYIVDAGGKRLRPLLVLLIYKCLNTPNSPHTNHHHIDLAAIIEFIHTATLLHDDVVDMSALRRGRKTANAQWGNAPSVLVGDFLYSRSFQMMVQIGNFQIMKILSNTTNIISEGEVQQLVNVKNTQITEEAYFDVIHKKTAALFEAACETGAVIATDNSNQHKAARRFGEHLGLAFQLIDDALDYSGDPETLGKNVGDDLAEGKLTLPLIYTINNAAKEDASLIKEAIIHTDSSNLERIINIVTQCGGLSYTKEKAQEQANKAEDALLTLPHNIYRDAMLELTKFSTSRSH